MSEVAVGNIQITPAKARIGGRVHICLDVTNTQDLPQRVLVDLAVFFIKASGQSSTKVFKLKPLELGARQSVTLAKTLSLAEMTTRKHYPGLHRVEVMLNGQAQPLGTFELAA